MSTGTIIPRDGGRWPHLDETSDESNGIKEAVNFHHLLVQWGDGIGSKIHNLIYPN